LIKHTKMQDIMAETEKVKSILITGANGFIGSALCSRLASGNNVVGVDIAKGLDKFANGVWERTDLIDGDSINAICEKYSPDVVIHCAGIAHQKIGAVDSAAYMQVNSEATENLARSAARVNPDVCFVFLSSVSVYGEGGQVSGVRGQESGKIFSRKGANAQRDSGQMSVVRSQGTGDGTTEDGECWPSSDYAVSKLDAERRLRVLYDEGKLHDLIILRLAPVYDRDWSLNLDRRVFAPGKAAYVRFGSGIQKMSALARPNLVEFIDFLIKSKLATDTRRPTGRKKDENTGLSILNVCDAEAYEFNKIIEVFRKSGIRPKRPVVSVPLSLVWLATRVAGVFLRSKQNWFHSFYDKLAGDLVFDNGRMMGMGFRPRHSLETILAADGRR